MLVSAEGLRLVKLSDVGMSRTLANSPYYKKQSKGKIPAKWMAPESLFDQKSTSASDVWSYGVFAWETLSSGAVPYADVDAEAAVKSILKGERLPRPRVCPPDLCVVSILPIHS